MSAAETDFEAERVQRTSGVTPESLEKTLKEQLGATIVNIVDMSGAGRKSLLHIESKLTRPLGGCGQMYEAMIVSPQFVKKTTLARHRLVNSALKEQIAAIHAWTPKCMTPEEYERKHGASS